jgi:hypothetical protein
MNADDERDLTPSCIGRELTRLINSCKRPRHPVNEARLPPITHIAPRRTLS